GRDEPRDFLDILELQRNVLPLGALCWAAAGKDPGFSPRSLLELLKRRGKYRPEDFERLHLTEKVDLQVLKQGWLGSLEAAEAFIAKQDPEDVGCLYFDTEQDKFVDPQMQPSKNIVRHFGRPGGVLPQIHQSLDSGSA
ncbi:MAG: hypothetical protein KDD44_02795, partial [Bdellovibrionales bacterium]|nr:hypothetical protein [Bdellovibrionales bacterium]